MYNISIIVLNYNSTEDTISCVNKINSFAGGYHIIVVDNCSPDNSFDIIKKHFKGDHNVDVIKTGSNDGYSSGIILESNSLFQSTILRLLEL